jgi:hypothetical protein
MSGELVYEIARYSTDSGAEILDERAQVYRDGDQLWRRVASRRVGDGAPTPCANDSVAAVIATDPALHEIRSHHVTRIVAEDAVAQKRPLVLRGPARRRGRWQSCLDEDSLEKWEGHDVSRERELCIVCFRGTAGGVSRWAWLGCDDFRAINKAFVKVLGFRPLALGRHSLMNGIGIRGDASPEVAERQAVRLAAFANGDGRLREWRRQEYGRLAAIFAPLADIPLRDWQEEWPPGRRVSVDAFSRLLGRKLPLHPTR